MVFVAIGLAWRRLLHNDSSTSHSRLLKQARQACSQKQQQQALSYLYQWLDYNEGNAGRAIRERVAELNHDNLRLTYDEMMQAIYSPGETQSTVTCRFIDQLTTTIKKQKRPDNMVQWAVEMKLN